MPTNWDSWPCSVAENGEVTPVTVPDTEDRPPLSLTTCSFAELLKLVLHAVSVDHVGCEAIGPLVGLNARCPGSLPMGAAADADAGMSSAAPTMEATTPSSTPVRLSLSL